jgi:UDP-N-acetyl-D-glucosamine dehydrogenase
VLLELLKQRGVEVSYYDPFVPVIKVTREHPQWAGTQSIQWNKELIASFDCVLIATAHTCVDYKQLASWAQLVVDTRNVMPELVGSHRYFKA